MIYRVGDGGDPSFDYSSQLKPARNTESQEKFSLNKRKEQEYTAKKEAKGEDKKLHEKPGAQNRTRDGVKLEISGGSNQEETQKQKDAAKTQTVFGGTSFLSVVQNLITAVKDFFYRVWNDIPPEPLSEDVTPEEAERYTEEYYAMKGIVPERIDSEAEDTASESEAVQTTRPLVESPQSYAADQAARDEKIRGHLRTGDLDRVISLLTDDGRRSVAKNSTLLTYYDKNGKLTQINASDRERILHGDRNVRKL